MAYFRQARDFQRLLIIESNDQSSAKDVDDESGFYDL